MRSNLHLQFDSAIFLWSKFLALILGQFRTLPKAVRVHSGVSTKSWEGNPRRVFGVAPSWQVTKIYYIRASKF